MTVKELIEKLSKMDETAEIFDRLESRRTGASDTGGQVNGHHRGSPPRARERAKTRAVYNSTTYPQEKAAF